jgi:hypothetical protein
MWWTGRARRLAASTALAAVALGCASGPALRDGVYRDPTQQWTIAILPSGWTRIEAEDVDLVFLGPGGATIGVTSRCEGVSGTAEALARQLRAGLGSHELLDERGVEVAGAAAVRQVLALDGARVAAVTRAAPPCVQDFVLVAPEGFDAALPVFDAWWPTFATAGSAR